MATNCPDCGMKLPDPRAKRCKTCHLKAAGKEWRITSTERGRELVARRKDRQEQ